MYWTIFIQLLLLYHQIQIVFSKSKSEKKIKICYTNLIYFHFHFEHVHLFTFFLLPVWDAWHQFNMAVLGKPLTSKITCTCYELGHTWTPSCKKASLDVMLEVFKQAVKVYGSLYAVSFTSNSSCTDQTKL